MAFSESLGFGDSTLMKLDSQVNHVLNGNDSIKLKDISALETISQSPDEIRTHKNKTINKSLIRTRGHLLQNITQSFGLCKNTISDRTFQRSKSDSKLSKWQMDSKDISSDFFRTNFTFITEEKHPQDSELQITEIEALADNQNDNEEINGKRILSDCLNDIKNEQNHCSPEMSLMDYDGVDQDISSFMCIPQTTDEMKNENFNLIKKELKQSHRLLQESGISLNNTASIDTLRLTSQSIQTKIKLISSINNNNKTEFTCNLESLKNMNSWNLPANIVEAYRRKGVEEMFDWQVECLSNPKVLFENCNLVYSAPTSAGKTLVSEILLIKTILERNKKAIMILPFISVVREKMIYLQDLLTVAGLRVEGFYGGYNPPGGFDSIQVAICTIEKANSIVNKLMEQGKLDEIGCIIVDEIHLVSDAHRGYILELLLAKILYMCRQQQLNIQIIAMSATLSNVELLKQWLDAELYITNYRPVLLKEMIKIEEKIYDNQLNILRTIVNNYNIPNDTEHITHLCMETLLEKCSVIIFCPSKDWCENLAIQLAQTLRYLMKQTDTDLSKHLKTILNRSHLNEVKQQLRDIPTGLDSILEKTITYGCAFHHAGITTEERDIIETSFKSGALKIIVATSTLSSGVNLPARRVLIRTPMFGNKQMNSLTYRQMIGRAGRTGKDTLGESILICTESNARLGKDLILADLKPISSCLELDNNTHLKRALLEVISSGVAVTKQEINLFIRCTLLSTQKYLQQEENKSNCGESHIEKFNDGFVNESLNFLLEYEFIRLQENEETNQTVYLATRLGMACLSSSMPPTDGLILFGELQKSRRCFVLESELHAVYLVTPFSVCYQLHELDWLLYLDLWEKLPVAMKKVGELVGVKESFLVRAMRGQTNLDYKLLQIHKRFYIALALQELVNETPINIIAHKYKCTRGLIQSLQQMASTFAGIVTSFCHSLQWYTLALIVAQFKERLYFGIHQDLIDLMRLPNLNHKRARALHKNGITTLIELANANKLEIEKILYDSLCFDSEKPYDHENEDEAKQRHDERNFFITGQKGVTVTEAAKLYIEEARLYVQHEIGVNNIKWSQSDNNNKEDTRFNPDDALDEIPLDVCNVQQVMPLENNGYKKEFFQMKTPDLEDTMCSQKVNCKQNGDHYSFLDEKNGNFKSQQWKQQQIRQQENVKPVNVSKETREKDNKEHEKSLKNTIAPIVNKYEQDKDQQQSKRQLNDHVNSTEKEITPIKQTRVPNDDPYINEKPSTSKKITRLLKAQHLSKVKKLEWAKRKSLSEEKSQQYKIVWEKVEEEKKIATQRPPENIIMMPIQNEIKQSNAIKEERAQTQEVVKQEIKQKLPNEVKEKDVSDDTFPIDDDLEEILKRAEKVDTKQMQKDEDEIPNTQIMKEEGADKAYPSSYQGHLLSSLRFTQKTESPHGTANLKQSENKYERKSAIKYVAKEKLESKAKSKQEIQIENESINDNCDIEFSNISLDNFLLKHPLQLNASHLLNCIKNENQQSSSFQSLDIIDICADATLFKNAFKELMASKRLSMCIGLQQQLGKRKPLIGGNLLLNQIAHKQNLQKEEEGGKLNNNYKYELNDDDSTYLDGIAFCTMKNIVLYMNMQEIGSCHDLTSHVKSHYLKLLLNSMEHTILMFEAKDQIKIILKLFPNINEIKVKLEDARIANWLLQPDKIHNLSRLVDMYAPECSGLINLCGSSRGYNSYGLDATNNILAKIRASIEACVTLHILKGLTENLQRIGNGELYKFFTELEMPLQLSLGKMELEGFPTNLDMLQKLCQQIVETMRKLELKIYDLNGGRFNLSSSAAVAKVLGLHQKYTGRITPSKQILQKIDTPMSQMIMTYRKLSVTLTKCVQPLLKCVQNGRIHGQSITFTATGRISMSEPNLQNVTKNFEVNLIKEEILISCRQAFQPNNSKRCLLSSDFCQLEMRILAHLCQDANLLKVMHSKNDIFRSIAAQWNKLSEDAVTDHLRNTTKQICYGIIYGMGMRSLANSLKCTEQEATLISEQFHTTYPGIRQYMDRVIKFAQSNGYVETVTGRRRYLEHINDAEIQIKKQAERQAVNATIQGSAADIVKNAIIRIEKNLIKYQNKMAISADAVKFILHIHDELIYEIPEDKSKRIAKVLSLTMEKCIELDVPLKVKLQIGKNWGEFKEFKM